MSKEVEIVAPETPLKKAAQRMLRRDCGCIFVAEDGRLVGIITDRDIALHCVSGGKLTAETTAKQAMSPELLYCRDTDTAGEVTRYMGENKVRRLAVLDAGKRLVGMVTLGDLSRHAHFLLLGKTAH